jgi:hypothetical protein
MQPLTLAEIVLGRTISFVLGARNARSEQLDSSHRGLHEGLCHFQHLQLAAIPAHAAECVVLWVRAPENDGRREEGFDHGQRPIFSETLRQITCASMTFLCLKLGQSPVFLVPIRLLLSTV